MTRRGGFQLKGLGETLILSLVVVLALQMGLVCLAEAQAEKSIVVASYGGTFAQRQRKAYFDPFTEKTGIKVVDVTAGGDAWGKAAAQIRAGNVEWDLTSSNYVGDMMAAVKKGCVEEVDYNIVRDAKDLVPGAAVKWGVGSSIVSYVVAYNTKAFPEGRHPKTWADFYDVEKFPGPRAMHNWGNPDLILFSALVADGVPPEKLIPIDFDRAFKKLNQIKKHVRLWYSSGDQLSQALQSGEVVLANSHIARAINARNSGAPIAIEWNQGMYTFAFWCIVKGAPHKNETLQFLNFSCRPENQAIFTQMYPNSPTHPKALEYLPAEMIKDQVIFPENLKKSIDVYKYVMPWTIDHWDEIVEKYNTWLGMS
jgi:putative spermidine/putrescine transport system substrate-binding protein